MDEAVSVVKDAILYVFGLAGDLFTYLDAYKYIIPLVVIGMFLSFVMLNRIGLLSRLGSDRVKYSKGDKENG